MLVAGSTIDGRYRLVSLIGEGGMASVWRAEDDNLRRAVAIKLLYLAPQRDPSVAVEQFLREARIAAAVQHRNVIHTMDFGTTEEGVPYMVMELLHGESLASRMQREPRLRVDEWVRIAEMTLRGLAAVHDAGIVHRDLKPQNIFLQRDADALYPKILDFGISRALATRDLASPIATQQGFVIGTPHYMAPEQARGDAQIDHRADIYSFGTILYEGLAGRLPFDAGNATELLVKIVSTAPVPLHELCPAGAQPIADCVARAMAHDRDQRFSDARAFRAALQRAAELCLPDSAHRHHSELPLAHAPSLGDVPVALPAGALTVPLQRAIPENDGGRATWGDFEGLAGRSSTTHVARERGDVAAAADRVPPAREPSGPMAKGRTKPRPQSGDVARASAADPEAFGGPQDGPMFGENPLDAFAGAAAVALELDYAPRQHEPRRSLDETPREKKPVEPVASPPPARVAPAASGWGWRLLWLLPGALALLLVLGLLFPGVFSMAPPDQAAAKVREAENAATRGSSRVLRRQPPQVNPNALPQDRELLE